MKKLKELLAKIIEKTKKNKRLSIIFVVVIALFCGAIIININKKDNMTAKEIFDAMKEDSDIKEHIVDYLEVNESNDDFNQLGKSHRYTSKLYFVDIADQEMYPDIEENGATGTIEVFNNEKDLKIRKSYFEYRNETIKKEFPEETYGDVIKGFGPYFNNMYVHQNKNALLILPDSLDESVIDLYAAVFDNVLEDKTYSQDDIPDKKTISSMKKEDQEEITDMIPGLHDAIDTILESAFEIIDNQIDGAETQLTRTVLDETKTLVEEFHHEYYQEKYNNWIARLQSIENQISQKEAKDAAEKQRAEELAKNRHRAGVYKVGSDIPAGEYVILGGGYFAITKDSTGTLDSIIANGNFDTNSIVTVHDGEYLEVSRGYFYSIDLNPEISTSGEGMFKVGLHIPAGEYKLVCTSSIMGYCAVLSSSRHTLGSIISNDNFTGEKYITVRDGQYLELSRCRISQ